MFVCFLCESAIDIGALFRHHSANHVLQTRVRRSGVDALERFEQQAALVDLAQDVHRRLGL
ncbi:hypothetical protein M885DRAFT_505258 [Pelagophyceae sp. CCMP2097]|nr:hypothetical protein M885DRAFT_505258 [Pelagophyceae sp. CCMP2097]